MTASTLHNPDVFSEILYEKMKGINPGIQDMELYEFRYCLNNLEPENRGWDCVELLQTAKVEEWIQNPGFFTGIQIKPQVDGRIVLDETIVRLTNMLFVGLVTGEYSVEWVRARFYFDVRGFLFLTRTIYFTDAVLAHLGWRPFRSFEKKQEHLAPCLELGYRAFKAANAEVDAAFLSSVNRLVAAKGTPIVLAIAGGTAAGKTEIVARLRRSFEQAGKQVTSVELDNFLTDRDQRERKGIHTLGRQAIHFDLFYASLKDILQGQTITIPRYDFIDGTSSHDLDGTLKPGRVPIEIEPAEIIFIEGNFPFLLEEIAPLIGIKVVYLTGDAIRLKRKWRRDIDYRKKYDPNYFLNRFFRNQPLMAEKCYRPQMQMCDLVVDTTGAAIWATPEVAAILSPRLPQPGMS
jgi:uridine kinase